MITKKRFLISVLFIITVFGFYFAFNLIFQKSGADIFKLSPRSGDAIASSEFLNAQRAVEYYREQIEKNPEQIKNYIELAQLFLQEARITGLHHNYLPKAERLLEDALRIDTDNFDALITKSSMLMTLHQFEKAKNLIQKAITINNYNAAAYGILCDAYVELGEYEKAVQTCDKMLNIRPDLRSYARASYLRELHGDIKGSIDAMMMAANAGVWGQENRAWTLYNLGILFLNNNKIDTAAFIFNGILEERPNYSYAFSGLADVFMVKKNYSKAIEYLVKASQSTPEHIFIEKLADIYKAMGQKESEEEMIKKVLEAFEQHRDDGYNIDLEYSRFCLDHDINLKEAMQSAEREYNRRPNNIAALEVYAWALYKMGKSEKAISYIEKAMRLNTVQANTYYRAGIIYKNVNRNEEAIKYLDKVFKDNSYVSPLYADSAKKVLNELRNIVAVN